MGVDKFLIFINQNFGSRHYSTSYRGDRKLYKIFLRNIYYKAKAYCISLREIIRLILGLLEKP